MNPFSSNQRVLISSLFLDPKKTKTKSCSRSFVTKGWDSKSRQLDLFHFLCWNKNKKRLHNGDSKKVTSKPCSLLNPERRKCELPTSRVCFYAASLLQVVERRQWWEVTSYHPCETDLTEPARLRVYSHSIPINRPDFWLLAFLHRKCSSDTNSFTSGSTDLSKGCSQTSALLQVKRFLCALTLFEIAMYFLVGIAYHHRACSALSEQFSFLFICG